MIIIPQKFNHFLKRHCKKCVCSSLQNKVTNVYYLKPISNQMIDFKQIKFNPYQTGELPMIYKLMKHVVFAETGINKLNTHLKDDTCVPKKKGWRRGRGYTTNVNNQTRSVAMCQKMQTKNHRLGTRLRRKKISPCGSFSDRQHYRR